MVSSHPFAFSVLPCFLAERSKVEMRNQFIVSGMSILCFKGKDSMFEPPMIAIKQWVLSEAQSYGMLITVAAAEKDKPNKQTLTNSITII